MCIFGAFLAFLRPWTWVRVFAYASFVRRGVIFWTKFYTEWVLLVFQRTHPTRIKRIAKLRRLDGGSFDSFCCWWNFNCCAFRWSRCCCCGRCSCTGGSGTCSGGASFLAFQLPLTCICIKICEKWAKWAFIFFLRMLSHGNTLWGRPKMPKQTKLKRAVMSRDGRSGPKARQSRWFTCT